MSDKKYKTVATGGTFDQFHAGGSNTQGRGPLSLGGFERFCSRSGMGIVLVPCRLAGG